MKLKEVTDPEERAVSKKYKLMDILDEFVRSDYALAEVVLEKFDSKNPYNATSALKHAIRYFHYNNVEARTINGKAYLIRKEEQKHD